MTMIPAGVTTATVLFGKDTDILGEYAEVTVRVTPSHTLIWAATGERIPEFEVTVQAADGMVGSFEIPHTDQDGFLDKTGNAITGWYYTAVGSVKRGTSSKPYRKVFQVTSDVETMDLDLIPENGRVAAPGVAPAAAVSSVNGNAGAVTVVEASDANVAARLASGTATAAALDVASAAQIDDTGSATRASLNATYDAKGATSAGLTRRFGPSFTAHPGAQVTHDASDLNSIYAPWVIKTEGIIPGALGAFYMYYSTDHDTGAGGIGLAYANSPTGPWTVHKPGGNPVIYVDAVDGDQTETPAVLYVPDDPDGKPLYMYYQQEGPSGGLNQSTALAKSADGITWTRVGLVIIGRSTWQGDGQTTYFRPFRVGDLFIGWHLIGGGDYGTTGISYSRDGLTWVTDPRRLGYFVDVLGGNTGRVMLRSVFQWRGEPWGLYGQEPYSSGFAGGSGKAFLTAKLTPDLRRFQGNTAEVFASLPSGVTEVDLWGHVIEHNGNLYMYYRANGAYGDIRVAVAEA